MLHMRVRMLPFCPRRRRLLTTGALTLLLPGCVGALFRRDEPPPPDKGPPDDVVARWRALGKLAARTGDGNWSASLDWRQADEDFRLRLSGPFGQGALQVEGSPGTVELTTARGDRRSARTPEALLVQELDWDLPASSLSPLGSPGGRAPAFPWRAGRSTRRGGSRPSRSKAGGWTTCTAGTRAGILSPDRITLRGEGVVVRIAIRDWRVD